MKPRLRTVPGTAVLLILFLIVSLIPPTSGAGWPEEQTRHIQAPPPGYDTDMFVTESGIGFSVDLVHVLDPNLDIYAYLFFRDMKMNSYFSLENATLRLHTASSLDFDADSTFTIYGIPDYRYFGMGDWGYGSPASIMSSPRTSARVVYNSSEFYGGRWWDIDVTNIVQELKSNRWYEGPGLNFNNPGDYMAFIILGASGPDTRWFYDLNVGNGFEAQLHLHWDFSPPPPSGYEDYEYVEDYDNYTIWRLNATEGYPLEPIEYIFMDVGPPHNIRYDTLHPAPGTPVTVDVTADYLTLISSHQRKIVRQSNGVIRVVYHKALAAKYQIYVIQSVDDGVNWIGDTRISTYAGMDVNSQKQSTMAVDAYDNLHVFWQGPATGFANEQLWYNKFDNSTQTWAGPVRISTYAGMDTVDRQWYGSCAVDSEDEVHVAWHGKATGYPNTQIWYNNYNGSDWVGPIRISNQTDMEDYAQSGPCVAVDSQDNLHVAWSGMGLGHIQQPQIWYSNYTTEWAIPLNVTTVDAKSHAAPVLAINSQDDIHLTWRRDKGAWAAIWVQNYTITTGWSTPLWLSDFGNMLNHDQIASTIAIGLNDSVYVLWEGTVTGPAFRDIWLSDYQGVSWSTPTQVQTPHQKNYPNLRWAKWPGETDATFIVVDGNGTVIMDNGDPLIFDDPDDAKDWIDTYDPDPEDPDPAGVWSVGPGGETGPFTRFRIRLYLLILGFGCVFGPVLFFSWRRPTGYYLLAGALVMMAGLGLLMAIGDI